MIGPGTEDALELVREARGGNGRPRRDIVQGVDTHNLIHVGWFAQSEFAAAF